MNRLIIITIDNDYLGPKFEGEREYHIASKLDVEVIRRYLAKEFEVEHIRLRDFDMSRNYKGCFVVYASSEKRGLIYKGYIEDVMLKLQNDGAVLVPRFELLRAHGNKAYQELMRSSFSDSRLKTPLGIVVGKYDDLDLSKFKGYPYVVKSSSGSGSSGVKLVKDEDELKKAVEELSKVTYLDYYYTNTRDLFYLPPIWKLKVKYYEKKGKSQSLTHPKRQMNDNKVIIQEYIGGLDSDYKVLYYQGKYFVLNRKNRKNDFRASGSGKFVFPNEVNQVSDILDYAELCAKEIDAPMISMDIAKTLSGSCHLIEFQCLCFGPYTAQYSEWHFIKTGETWEKIIGKIDLEEETARSITEYIDTIVSRVL